MAAEYDEEDIIIANTIEQMNDNESMKFDAIVGVLESMLLDKSFLTMQESFRKGNSDVFDTHENKLEYTEIFQTYTAMMENFVETFVTDRVEGITMDCMMTMLADRPEEITGDVFDVLASFADYEEFKQLMLSYKSTDFCHDISSELSL
mmetsp:Transcript_4831/g.5436  ORF Transcript_4831/g.5436 Transcript_4831/m.5436 type:complete len:149 (-) Transcript_4831:160-606(-)